MSNNLKLFHQFQFINYIYFENLTNEHLQAGSFLFEHRDVRMVLPDDSEISQLENFNFNFLFNSNWKKECTVRRVKTRVIVNASKFSIFTPQINI